MNAEFSTAQAVTPGQGQTVRVSGVQVGDIGGVTLKNGIAIVAAADRPEVQAPDPHERDRAAAPADGLKDMFIELNPGTTDAPAAKPGYTIPVSNTHPDINLDEILSSLDADTRAVPRAARQRRRRRPEGQGRQRAGQVLERFEPTHRDLARVNQAVAVRGREPAAAGQLAAATEHGACRPSRARSCTLVDSSSRVFRAFASEDQNISRAIADLPATLHQTTATLGKVQTFAEAARPDGQQPAPRRAGAAGRQRGADRARHPEHADRPRTRSGRS